MVEKVARAMFETGAIEGVTLPWEEITEGHRELIREHARAAIKAMKKPDPKKAKVRSVDIADIT